MSVITTKRAYSDLEEAGFIETVRARAASSQQAIRGFCAEEELRRMEALLALSGGARRNARRCPRRFA